MSTAVTRLTETGAEGTAFLCDTLCRMTVFGSGNIQAIEMAFAACAKLERELSCYSTDGDIKRLNQSDHGTAVSEKTAELLRLALECCALSDGCFDITAHSGYISREVSFSVDGTDVSKLSGVSFDLGGIAKGYIADAAADVLREHGVNSAIVDFGGNIVLLGDSPAGRPWNVGIREPAGGNNSYFAVVEAEANTSVVTSAEYERGRHIINPRTGRAADTDCISATAIARSSAFADAMATALFIGGETLAAAMLERGAEFDAVIAKKSGRVFYTPGLEGRIRFC